LKRNFFEFIIICATWGHVKNASVMIIHLAIMIVGIVIFLQKFINLMIFPKNFDSQIRYPDSTKNPKNSFRIMKWNLFTSYFWSKNIPKYFKRFRFYVINSEFFFKYKRKSFRKRCVGIACPLLCHHDLFDVFGVGSLWLLESLVNDSPIRGVFWSVKVEILLCRWKKKILWRKKYCVVDRNRIWILRSVSALTTVLRPPRIFALYARHVANSSTAKI